MTDRAIYAIEIADGAVAVGWCPWHGGSERFLLVNTVDGTAECCRCGRAGDVIGWAASDQARYALVKAASRQLRGLESPNKPLG
ncbi:MAG: hypothetical protein KGH75_13820 [Rhodospirillales bacterium]|nr:hypothetical protein [Rhodospirillales bacterium]